MERFMNNRVLLDFKPKILFGTIVMQIFINNNCEFIVIRRRCL